MSTQESQPPRTCRQCGNVLPKGKPDSECPHCLLGLGLDAPEADDDSSPRGDAADPTAGLLQEFGDYRLLELLGAGGMGRVYKARQASLGRLVAIKMIRAGPLPRPELVERFRREARTVAQLQHPGIVGIHEVGEVEGQPYFAMEYIEGGSLAERARAHPLPPRRAATYVQAVAEAIHYAHQQGVLHRDLKPSNILVNQLDQPKVTDFGVAKLLRGESDLTLTGQRIGSPSYMAPEQAAGHADRVDARTDVYALGAVLYHLVAGRPPFLADTTERALALVLGQDPIPLRRLNPSIPPDLETISAKCLEKEPSQRYPSAQALAEDLGRFLRAKRFVPGQSRGSPRRGAGAASNPLPAGLGTAAAILLLLVAIGGPIAAARQAALAKSNRRISYGAAVSAAWQSWKIGNVTRTIDLLKRQIPSPRQEEDLREFTWRYLWKLCEPARESNRVSDPSNAILLSAVSRDGTRFATSGIFGDVTGMGRSDTFGGLPIQHRGLTSGGLAFTPDGRRLVTTGQHVCMGDPRICRSGTRRPVNASNRPTPVATLATSRRTDRGSPRDGGRTSWCGT